MKPENHYETVELTEEPIASPKPFPEVKQRRKVDRIILAVVVVAIIVIVAVIVPVTLNMKKSPESPASSSPPDTSPVRAPTQADYLRVDCSPDPKEVLTKEQCQNRGCLHDPTNNADIPVCYFPPSSKNGEGGYRVSNKEDTKLGRRITLELKNPARPPYKDAVATVELVVEERGDNFLRFKFHDPNDQRYEVPVPLDRGPDHIRASQPRYKFVITAEDPFSFQILRRGTDTVLWDTSVGGFTFADQFLQIATKLPSMNIYGFGENPHKSFRHDLNFKTWPMFSRDQPPSFNDYGNLYGVHPFYTCLENDGNSHGVLLLNSNAMDYSFTSAPMLTYRTIGGILDFYMFFGPSPENVIQQYTEVIGRPYMPPYWSLGFQLCQYGYKNLTNLQAAVNRTREYNIPQDVQYADIDHMDERKDFTVDPVNFGGLQAYFTHLQDNGMHIIIILVSFPHISLEHEKYLFSTLYQDSDPALITNNTNYEPYDLGLQEDLYIKWPNESVIPDTDKPDISGTRNMHGWVWPSGKAVFPDFFLNRTADFWRNLTVKHVKTLTFDGLWIDMNEPANFGTNLEKIWNWPEGMASYWSLKCPENSYDDPPYRTKAAYTYDSESREARLSDNTLCMIAEQEDGQQLHYNVHSLYGWSQTEPTLNALRAAVPGKRGMVISRSTYPGSGRHAGHWLGDNDSRWPHLHESIIGMLEFNLFGIPYIGADICGFWGETTAEMCKRWMELGAFYPFSRNHNGIDNMPQDPGYFGEEVAVPSREALLIRYRLLPYLYTLFHIAHTRGNTVIRPLMHEFPTDNRTWGIDRQFLWGPAFMIVPVLEQGVTSLAFYLPKARWYDYHTGAMVTNNEAKDMSLPIKPDSPIHLYVRGGFVIPGQEPDLNTVASRQRPFSLLVALDDQETAMGELFWDDGDSIDTYESGDYFLAKFKANQMQVEMEIQHNNDMMSNLTMGSITVLGVKERPLAAYVNGKLHFFDYDSENRVLKIDGLAPYLKMNESFIVEWSATPKATEEEKERLDCFPESADHRHITEQECLKRRCLWKLSLAPGVPYCYLPKDTVGYTLKSVTDTANGKVVTLQWLGQVKMFDNPVRELNLKIEELNDHTLHFKFHDPNNDRYEVPVPLENVEGGNSNTRLYEYETKNDTNGIFYLRVWRKSTNITLWDSRIGGFVFEDRYIQISTRLPSQNVYGFGENKHHSFRHDMNFNTWPMFSRDQPPPFGERGNLYGVHPFYTCLEDNNGNMHGVFLLNSNAMEYKFLPAPGLTYRTIGGVLDFYVFLGPEPEDVVKQYEGLIGKPHLPPYWSLGFQLCRYGYNSLRELKAAVDRTVNASIPYDIQYADIDHMDGQMDFTVDQVNFKGLEDYIRDLQSQGMRFIIILDPALITNVSGYRPYDMGLERDIFIKWPQNYSTHHLKVVNNENNMNMLGYVWPRGKVVFPDFLNPNSSAYWQKLIVDHHKNVSFDGLWIDMNEPANFGTNEERPFNWPKDVKPYWSLHCPENEWDDPPYKPRAVYGPRLSDKTLCMIGVQQSADREYRHYDVHSLYGWSQTEPTLLGAEHATGERSIVISRSTYPSSGKYAGHWLGDNASQWSNLYQSIIGMLEFNLFGIPYIGADICGYFDDTTPELCQRWMQLGAFYPFSRNHNGYGYRPQDPAVFGPVVAESSRRALEIRYTLLPYLYTLFYRAHTEGGTVIRPLLHEFPRDPKTWSVDRQFLWGPALLISPVLEQGRVEVDAYFPEARWFDYYTGTEIKGSGQTHTLDAPMDYIPLHVRGGYIIPTQAPANNTHFSRMNPFGLLVVPDSSGTASGELFWDDGSSKDTVKNETFFHAKFSSNRTTLSMEIKKANFNITETLDNLRIMGIETEPAMFSLTSVGSPLDLMDKAIYNSKTKEVILKNAGISLQMDFVLSWQ
ncbi:sucrase-isomaltase, intestinal [Lingula anatina]|uniref:Sucrase-isomaltase, intestinal n=1 Tax=Lingula anatina TaxID=7574 RepID=A0A1S3KEF8_LINAN|nr:sucrase-isomaltase, intestinal [Lingula anatina]|eukprot:XP_013421015.1 sucrase-isomaltase, intestinal [Lingula anatina]